VYRRPTWKPGEVPPADPDVAAADPLDGEPADVWRSSIATQVAERPRACRSCSSMRPGGESGGGATGVLPHVVEQQSDCSGKSFHSGDSPVKIGQPSRPF